MTENTSSPKIGSLRVVWNPQVGKINNFFTVSVSSIEEAWKIMNTLADYDLYQFNENIKGDYVNMGDFQIYEEDNGEGEPGWCTFYTDDGDTIDDIMRR